MRPKPEYLEVFPETGIDLRSLDKSIGPPFLQNIVPLNHQADDRRGFGVLYSFGTTLNAGRLTTIAPSPKPTGSDAHTAFLGLLPAIGAFPLRTSFGHDQILSIHPVWAFNGNCANEGGQWGASPTAQLWISQTQGSYFVGVAAHVHDLTTNRHCEFILHSQDTQSTDLSTCYPHYSSRFNRDNSRWVRPADSTKWAVFTQMQREVLICIDGCGAFYYRPIDPAIDTARHQSTASTRDATPAGTRQINSLPLDVIPAWTGEQSALAPLTLHDGIFATDGVAYLRQPEDFANPQAICTLDQRTVYAVGNTCWFSDPSAPEEIPADNSLTLPTGDPITMIAQIRGNLIVATQFRTWLFQPNSGSANITGQLLDLAVGIGCQSNQSYNHTGDSLIWIGSRGAYRYSGGLEIVHLSESVDPWWNKSESLQMPLTSYFTHFPNGFTQLADPQPSCRIDIPAQNFRVVWQQTRKTAYFVGQDITLCYTDGYGWHVWQYMSHAGNNLGAVQAAANLQNPILIPIQENLYMLAGSDNLIYQDNTSQIPGGLRDSSCTLLKLGRGGALDRSTDTASATPTEFHNEPQGGWTPQSFGGDQAGFWIGKPITMPKGYRSALQTFTAETFWFPLYLSDPGNTDLDSFKLNFKFDDANWTPLFKPAVAAFLDACYVGPTIAARKGFGDTTPAATTEIRCYDGGGTVNPAGNEIRVHFNGNTPPAASWDFQPTLVLNPRERNLLCYLPFQRKATVATTTTQLGIDSAGLDHFVHHAAGNSTATVWRWDEGDYPEALMALAALAQPLDYAIKSKAMHTPNYDQIRVQGIWIRERSFGRGTALQVPNWPIGPINSTTSTDYKDFCAQQIDMGGVSPAVQATTQQLDIANGGVRKRLWNAVTKKLEQKLGGATGPAKWATTANPTPGNLLIDDPAVDTVQSSDGSMGESASIMVFGTLNSPGAGVAISSMQAQILPTGGRKRGGRQ